MAYTVRTTDNAGDLGRAADQNESVDNDAWLYANLQTEIADYDPRRPSASAGAASDEFQSTALNVAWTAVGIASGTVSFLETGAVDEYDLATFPGWLAFQTDDNGNSVNLSTIAVRKAWAPGTGPWSVIARVTALNLSQTDKNQAIGFMVSDDTTPTNYTNLTWGMESTSDRRILFRNQGGNIVDDTTEDDERHYYLALVRETAGGTTAAWASYDGLGWFKVGTTATATVVAYLWIDILQQTPTVRPIYMIDFIRTFDTATLTCGRGGNT